MSLQSPLAQLSALVGILPSFQNMQGDVVTTRPETQIALLEANGIAARSAAEIQTNLRHFEVEKSLRYAPEDVVLEIGRARRVAVTAPVEWVVLSETDGAPLAEGRGAKTIDIPGLPDGVHSLKMSGAAGRQTTNLIVAPPRAPLLPDLTRQSQVWGVVAALYGLQTHPRKSLADFGDLGDFAKTLGASGAAFLGINPVHALGWTAQDVISPYSPTHRGFLNTDFIRTQGLNPLAEKSDLIDYGAHRAWQRAALQQEFEKFNGSGMGQPSDYRDFCASGGQALEEFALFEAFSEQFGDAPDNWPKDVKRAPELAARIRFHTWLQWRADRQLASAQDAALASGMPLGLYLDLAVGARAGGAESWGDTSVAATGVSLGAPPDALSPAGQNWQLTAYAPHKLRAAGYAPFRFVLRQNMRHCGVLRIDHALGLQRNFWIPDNGAPGGYIRQPLRALLAVIALEAYRSSTLVIGEDLGLVPDGFRDQMKEAGFYGYSVLQFEQDSLGNLKTPGQMRAQSLACFGTHDTPTLAGYWECQDIALWQKLGLSTRDHSANAARQRAQHKRQLAGTPTEPLQHKATADVRDTVHARLASEPSALVAVQLDDMLGVKEAQNLPGTIEEHPNWRRLYPKTLDEIRVGPELKKTAELMAKAGRTALTRKDNP